MAGRLIALEGIDGSGKTTQAKLLAAATGARFTFEPGATPAGALLRRLLLDPTLPPLGPLAEALVVQAGEGTALALDQVQPEGRGPMGGAAWWRGARLPAGTRLGEERSGGR
ncbi:hypothetical protein ACFFRE_05140 [Aciditerrimonas ferrireducens]|uniref:Thymidylate kinase-like domain-containing protein n=1 Tax=Aciditerrimonas ferrireducens TaxID=667306 RepID=A0ABV6C1H1_9ACTN